MFPTGCHAEKSSNYPGVSRIARSAACRAQIEQLNGWAEAAKTDTFLGARYRRLIKRMPKPKAHAAIARSILVIIFNLLADPTTGYEDLESGYYDKRLDRNRRTANLVHQLQALGHQVTPTPVASAAP